MNTSAGQGVFAFRRSASSNRLKCLTRMTKLKGLCLNAANTSTILIILKIWGSSCFCLFLAALHALGARILWERKSKTCIVCCCACTYQEIQAYEKVHAVLARSTFPSQNVQSTSASDHFWKLRCRKSARLVARNLFPSQNVQNTPCSDHFWKLRCRKSARRSGAKHISKSKCTKHLSLGPLLEVAMSKNCTPLWREAHFEVKMYKTHHVRTTFGSCDVEKVHAVVAQSTFPSQNVQNTIRSDHFWKLRCRKIARCCGAKHISKWQCTKHHMFAPLLEVQMPCGGAGARDCAPCQKWAKREGLVAFSTTTTTTPHYTPIHYTTTTPSLHSTTLHSTTLHCTQLHSIALHYTTLHYTTLHSTTLHNTTFHYTSLHYTTLHSTTLQLQLHSTTLHYTKLHYTTLHYTTLHSTTLHYTTLPSTTLHYITLHYTPLHYKYNYNYTPLH